MRGRLDARDFLNQDARVFGSGTLPGLPVPYQPDFGDLNIRGGNFGEDPEILLGHKDRRKLKRAVRGANDYLRNLPDGQDLSGYGGLGKLAFTQPGQKPGRQWVEGPNGLPEPISLDDQGRVRYYGPEHPAGAEGAAQAVQTMVQAKRDPFDVAVEEALRGDGAGDLLQTKMELDAQKDLTGAKADAERARGRQYDAQATALTDPALVKPVRNYQDEARVKGQIDQQKMTLEDLYKRRSWLEYQLRQGPAASAIDEGKLSASDYERAKQEYIEMNKRIQTMEAGGAPARGSAMDGINMNTTDPAQMGQGAALSGFGGQNSVASGGSLPAPVASGGGGSVAEDFQRWLAAQGGGRM
ncbi:MAG: hypothetical protein ABFD89_22600 [Bryobacteraceae bacterium]